jgi:hypothetical protein
MTNKATAIMVTAATIDVVTIAIRRTGQMLLKNTIAVETVHLTSKYGGTADIFR